eukprot:1754720-Pyramimonas_sp.AAC.1
MGNVPKDTLASLSHWSIVGEFRPPRTAQKASTWTSMALAYLPGILMMRAGCSNSESISSRSCSRQ